MSDLDRDIEDFLRPNLIKATLPGHPDEWVKLALKMIPWHLIPLELERQVVLWKKMLRGKVATLYASVWLFHTWQLINIHPDYAISF